VQSRTARMPLLMATKAFGLGRRRWSSPQQFYLHCVLDKARNRTKSANVHVATRQVTHSLMGPMQSSWQKAPHF